MIIVPFHQAFSFIDLCTLMILSDFQYTYNCFNVLKSIRIHDTLFCSSIMDHFVSVDTKNVIVGRQPVAHSMVANKGRIM